MYSQQEREIFEFQDGDGKKRLADPLAVHRRLSLMLGGEVQKALDQTKSDIPEVAFPAFARLGQATCIAFDLGFPLTADKLGVTEATWLRVLNEWTDWLEKKNPISASSPMSPPAMDRSTNSTTPLSSVS